MGFSDQELKAIGEVQRLLHIHRRGWISLGELPSAVIHEIALADASRIAPHCMALLPEGTRPHVEACLDRLVSSDFQADLVLHVGPGLSDEKRAWLRLRYRTIVEQIREYHRCFGDQTETPEVLAVPEVDRFWETLRGLRSEDGSKCRSEGCDEPTVRVSVYCARHHYESIEKRSPPDY